MQGAEALWRLKGATSTIAALYLDRLETILHLAWDTEELDGRYSVDYSRTNLYFHCYYLHDPSKRQALLTIEEVLSNANIPHRLEDNGVYRKVFVGNKCWQ